MTRKEARGVAAVVLAMAKLTHRLYAVTMDAGKPLIIEFGPLTPIDEQRLVGVYDCDSRVDWIAGDIMELV